VKRGRPFKNAPRPWTDAEIREAYGRSRNMKIVAAELGISLGAVWNHTHDLVSPRGAREVVVEDVAEGGEAP
jgi:hypothetical protein